VVTVTKVYYDAVFHPIPDIREQESGQLPACPEPINTASMAGILWQIPAIYANR